MSLSSASRPNPPSKEAWEAVREEITWLYMSADKTLRDVMNIMRQTRNFIATEKMYKTRIRDWSLLKYRTTGSHSSTRLSRVSGSGETSVDNESSRESMDDETASKKPSSPLYYTSQVNDYDKSDSGYSTSSSRAFFILISDIASLLFYDEDIQLAIAKIADRSQSSEEIAGEIVPFLYYYGQDLNLISTDATQLAVSEWLQRHAREIASAMVHQFLEQPIWQPAQTAEAERQFQTYFRQHVQSVVTLTGTGAKNPEPYEMSNQPLTPVERFDGVTLDDVQEFLISSEAFERFVSFLTRSIRWDASKAITDELNADLISPQLEPADYVFHILWELESFIREEAHSELLLEGNNHSQQRNFEDILVISGAGETFSASSFQSYLRWLAPETAETLLGLLGAYLFGQPETRPKLSNLQLNLSVNSPNSLDVRARGSPRMIEQVAKSLAWIAAAIRIPVQKKIMISDARFVKIGEYEYQLSCRRLQVPFWGVKAACWLKLLPGTVVAHSWPTPEGRDDFKGLELPFSLMKTLIGATYPMRYQNGFYLQGYSRLLFPAQGLANSCVQWHMISSPSRDDELACDTILNCAVVQGNELGNLVDARTFLGFCNRVTVNLGTYSSADDYSSIRHSQSMDEAHPLDFLLSSGTMGGGYKGFINVSATMSMTFGKTLSSAVHQPENDYLDILRLASRRPLILYDDHPSRGGRAWMVPMLSVILHMIHTFVAQEDDFEKSLPAADRTWNSAAVAKQLLIRHADLIVRRAEISLDGATVGKAKSMKDLVAEYWNGLTSLATIELLAGNERRPETGKLYSWDYMDIVMGKPHVRRKQVTFSSNWLPLTKDNLVLIGQDFGEVIATDPATRVCRSWTTPNLSGKQYLIASIKCLQTLSWERGDDEKGRSCSRLADETYWHMNNPRLFADCDDCVEAFDRGDVHYPCSKTPQALTSTSLPEVKHQHPPPEGAVVFGSGESNKLRKRNRRNSSKDEEEGAARSRSNFWTPT